MTQRNDDPGDRAEGRPGGGNKRLSRQAVDGAKWVFLGMVLQTLLGIATIAVLARLLTPAEFGVMAAVMVIIALGEIRLGAGAALVQIQDLRDSHVGCAFYIALAIGCALGLLVYGLSDLLEAFLRVDGTSEPLKLLAVTFLLRAISQTLMRLLQRRLAFRSIAVLKSIAYFFGYGLVGIGLALSGQGVWSLVWAHLVMCGVMLVLLSFLSRKYLSFSFDRPAFRDLLVASGGISLLSILHHTFANLTQIFVARAFGAVDLGLFTRSLDLTNRVNRIFDRPITSVLFPVYSRMQEDKERVAAGFRQGVMMVAIIVLPISAAMILLAPELVLTILGSQWTDAVPVFQVLCVALVFRIGSRMANALASGLGHFYAMAGVQFSTLVVLTVLLFIAISHGLTAVAWAYTASTFVSCALSMRLVLRLSGVSIAELLAAVSRSLPLTIATSTVIFASRELTSAALDGSAALSLVTVLSVTGLLIGAAILMFPRLALTDSGRQLTGKLLDNLFPASDPFGFKRAILR